MMATQNGGAITGDADGLEPETRNSKPAP